MFATTEGERRRNSAIVNRRRVLLEAWVEPKLRRAMRKAGQNAALEYGRGGMGRVDIFAIEEYRNDIKEILVDLYAKTGKDFSKIVVQSGKSFGIHLETKNVDTALEELLAFFEGFALVQAKLIAETMKEEIVETIQPLVAEGASEGEIGRAIRQRVVGLAPWQANRIARTETLMASSASQDQVVRAMDDMPPMAKEWDSSRDSRTRKAHRKVEPVLMEEKFSVGGKLMRYPGDSAGGKENVINCRCVVNYAPASQMAELRVEAEERAQDIEEELRLETEGV